MKRERSGDAFSAKFGALTVAGSFDKFCGFEAAPSEPSFPFEATVGLGFPV